jgi:predicted RNase H-like HicB family nuclease
MNPVATYRIEASWDPEAKVWVATSEDVPGLATEAATVEDLTRKLRVLVPELLDANGVSRPGISTLSFELTSHRQEFIQLAS